VSAFVLDPDHGAKLPYSVFDVSAGVRGADWLVPVYTFPAHREDLSALRIVVRNGLSRDLADLLDDLRRLLDRLGRQTAQQRGGQQRNG
jgi:glutamate decarboxylase